jgi:AcrR family transcriptional regulator
MPKGFSDYEKELIGQRLLDQGYKLFSTYGLKKTNIEEIAKAAGISKGAFYNFYESKEALFMDVIEEVEKRVRQEILTAVDLPGPSPRARLFNVLKRAFNLFETVPILQFLTTGDYDQLFRRIPPEKLQEHLASDSGFLEEMIAHCQKAGIPIRAPREQMTGLLYQLVLAMLHKDDLGLKSAYGSIDLLLELTAAYCLGEVDIQLQSPFTPGFDLDESHKK